MAKVITLYPKVTVWCPELNEFFKTTPGAIEGQYILQVTLPQNDTDDIQLYNFEIYVKRGVAPAVGTGIYTTVTVGYQTIYEYYEVNHIVANPDTLPWTGGTVLITINFDDADPEMPYMKVLDLVNSGLTPPLKTYVSRQGDIFIYGSKATPPENVIRRYDWEANTLEVVGYPGIPAMTPPIESFMELEAEEALWVLPAWAYYDPDTKSFQYYGGGAGEKAEHLGTIGTYNYILGPAALFNYNASSKLFENLNLAALPSAVSLKVTELKNNNLLLTYEDGSGNKYAYVLGPTGPARVELNLPVSLNSILEGEADILFAAGSVYTTNYYCLSGTLIEYSLEYEGGPLNQGDSLESCYIFPKNWNQNIEYIATGNAQTLSIGIAPRNFYEDPDNDNLYFVEGEENNGTVYQVKGDSLKTFLTQQGWDQVSGVYGLITSGNLRPLAPTVPGSGTVGNVTDPRFFKDSSHSVYFVTETNNKTVLVRTIWSTMSPEVNHTLLEVYAPAKDWHFKQEGGKVKAYSDAMLGQFEYNPSTKEFELDQSVDLDYCGTPFGIYTAFFGSDFTKIWLNGEAFMELDEAYLDVSSGTEIGIAVNKNDPNKVLILGPNE